MRFFLPVPVTLHTPDSVVVGRMIGKRTVQLNTTYVDLLLFHHRCKTSAETAAVWTAFETAKKIGKAKHIGVSNFNTYVGIWKKIKEIKE